METELLKHSDLWTSGRYALVELQLDRAMIFDLIAQAPLVLDVDDVLYAEIISRMRAAGVKRLTPADIKAR